MFEFFFKYPPEVFANGTFVLAAGWPVWILVLLSVLVVLGLGCLLWWRSRFHWNTQMIWIWLLQSALAVLLLFLLWQPSIRVPMLKAEQNVIAIAVDDSKSMAIPDAGRIRKDEAVSLLQGALIRSLEERFVVRLYRIGADASHIDAPSQLAAKEPATHLGRALQTIAADAGTLPIGAVVLLSDGSDNTGGISGEAISALRQRKLPVHTVGFGREKMQRDIELTQLQIPSHSLANSRLEALVTLEQQGFTGSQTRITLRDGAKVLAARNVTLEDTPLQTERLLFNVGDAGVRNLQVEIAPLNGEESSANNQITRVLYADSAPRRLLYVEGEPRWEYKFLRRAVEDDPQLQVVSMLRTTQNKLYRQGVSSSDELEQGFPTHAEELFSYQGIILGSVEAAYFTRAQQELIKQFVDRRGGGLLFLGGRASLADGGYNTTPFSDLLPVILPDKTTTFQRDMVETDLTPAGKDSLICRIEEDTTVNAERWQTLPLLANYQDAGVPKPGAVDLVDVKVPGQGKKPLLITQPYGRGRTAVFSTAGTWRWKMQQPVGDRSQPTFWRQLLRWMVDETPSPVVLSVSQALLQDDDQLELRAEVRDRTYSPVGQAEVEARIIQPDGSGETVLLTPDSQHPGMYSANWSAQKQGAYIVEAVAKNGTQELGRNVLTFQRQDGTAEEFGRSQNREILEKLSEATGGRYYTPDDAHQIGRSISYSEAGVSARETKDLWNMPSMFLLAILLRASEWLLRRKWGTV